MGIRIGANSVLEPGARNEIGMGIARTRENRRFGARELFGSRSKKLVLGAHEKIGCAV